jgi:L-asparaginase
MKKKILLITTGGTIASRSGGSGALPQMSAEEILRYVPSVSTLCRVESLPLYNLDSTNMEPRHWLGMAHAVRTHYDDCDGFVILHGTDTMSYSAAALSYLMQGLAKPVVLTGAQRPVDKEVTDAKRNLTDSLLYAADGGSFGVSVVFDGAVIAARARAKAARRASTPFRASTTRTSPWCATAPSCVTSGKRGPLERHFSTTNSTTAFRPQAYPRHEPGDPAAPPAALRRAHHRELRRGGHPLLERDGFMDALGVWAEAGGLLIMTTQVPHEGSDMGLYKVGMRVKERFDLIEAYDMTLEATVTSSCGSSGRRRTITAYGSFSTSPSITTLSSRRGLFCVFRRVGPKYHRNIFRRRAVCP